MGAGPSLNQIQERVNINVTNIIYKNQKKKVILNSRFDILPTPSEKETHETNICILHSLTLKVVFFFKIWGCVE